VISYCNKYKGAEPNIVSAPFRLTENMITFKVFETWEVYSIDKQRLTKF